MEGFILAVSPTDRAAKKVWQTVFLKLDEISAKLVAFTDRSQFCVQWSVPLVGADIATPIPGEVNHGVNVEDTAFCFYVRSVAIDAASDECHYLAAPSDDVKKQWMAVLLKSAREGPQTPRFATPRAESEYSFQARVVKFRTHDDGKHAEYMITCSCQLFSKMAARRLAKQWDVWHRFSDFDTLSEALKTSLGAQLTGIDFVKHRRDALRSIFGSALAHDFLEERRLQLDTYVTRVCALGAAVEFFKHHADPHLKTFFRFDEHCQHVDESSRKAKGSRTKEPKSSRRSDRGSLDNDADASAAHDSVSSSSSSSTRASDASRRSDASVDSARASTAKSMHKSHQRPNSDAKSASSASSSSSDKRERHASKKKDKHRHKAALSGDQDIDAVRSVSPTSAH